MYNKIREVLIVETGVLDVVALSLRQAKLPRWLGNMFCLIFSTQHQRWRPGLQLAIRKYGTGYIGTSNRENWPPIWVILAFIVMEPLPQPEPLPSYCTQVS